MRVLERLASPADEPAPLAPNQVVLVASGDLRPDANRLCWPAQAALEALVEEAFAREGIEVLRGHPVNPVTGHGFISSQRMGLDVFAGIHPDAPVVVAEAVWQYTHHVLPGLRRHRGPILAMANWSGQWPGLVGLLNLTASMTKAQVPYSSIWSVDFQDEFARNGIREWIRTGSIVHDTSHVRDLDPAELPMADAGLGRELAADLMQTPAILGIFDEGCMGMYNAFFDDELLNPSGFFKERLSQSALYAAMLKVEDAEAVAALDWLLLRGMKFKFGTDEATELTEWQVAAQLKMYIAAVRMAEAFGCDAIGIQYQQGLKDVVPASDLAEGLLNNPSRPPVFDAITGRELRPGKAVPHFNEVDEGAAVDAVVTNRVWTALGFDPSTTLHDVRWGDWYGDDFVWVFQISGAVPASHLEYGYASAVSERQSPMYFALGGGTLKGACKAGEMVWSRVFVMDGRLHADIGRATAVALPAEEAERRSRATSYEWPCLNAVMHGVTRDQFMARHRANHIQVAYAPSSEDADRALAAKAAMFDALGLEVHLCGDVLGRVGSQALAAEVRG
jgi:hypothetical protein